jgi:transcriptional regulator with XRE-family HTH domain
MRFRYGDATLNAGQCRMARAALEIGVRELAEAAKVSTNTITRLERGEALQERTLAAIRRALEAAGVVFVAENGDGPGVRLRKAGQPQILQETSPDAAAQALAKAEAALDKKLSDVDVGDEEKARRKKVLTRVPKSMTSKPS